MAKLILPPDQQSYAVIDGKEILVSQLIGGLGRYRRDILNTNEQLRVTAIWTVSQSDYEYLKTFFNTNEALTFDIDLLLDSGELTTVSAHLIPGTFGLRSQNGQTYTVGAELDVMVPYTVNFDVMLPGVVAVYGHVDSIGAANYFLLLEQLANNYFITA